MIKLVVNPSHEPKSFCFSQDIIIIGEGTPECVDICFPSLGLHQNHIKIFKKEDGYWIFNQANDPFVTYNGQPFGKKKIQEGDILHIRDHVVKIDKIGSKLTSTSKVDLNVNPNQNDFLESYPDSDILAYDENPEAWFPHDLASYNDSSVKESEVKIPYKKEPPNDKIELIPKKIHNHPSPPQKTFNWKIRALKYGVIGISFIFLIFGLILIEVYFRAQNKSGKEQMLAAESIADYAMALTYAKVYHIAPQKQNWVDPQFIKNSLIDLLSTTSIPCGNIDSQGQFSNCPYLLRFYTNNDFSRFLLIAQPSPTLSQWLMPKETLLIDSTLMDLRKTSDVRVLNRLLSNVNPLDGANGNEVLAAIKQTEIIPLTVLSKSIQKKEFSPPKALSYLKPGAENLIYNAPRYYQFGGTFLKKVRLATQQPLDMHELALFQNEWEILSKYPYLVFYSSEGMQEAVQGYRSLKKLIGHSTHNFFAAYLLYSNKGDIINSHLVMDIEPTDNIAFSENITNNLISNKIKNENDSVEKVLREKAEEIYQTLTPILHNLQTLVSDTIEKDRIYLPNTFFQLITFYNEQKELAKVSLEKTLGEIQINFPDSNSNQIEKLLREFGLLDLYTSQVPEKQNNPNSSITWNFMFKTSPFSLIVQNESNIETIKDRWKAYNQLNDLSYKKLPYPICPNSLNCILK